MSTWIIGGGAKVNYSEPSSLLTGSFPESAYWVATGKDHVYASPATSRPSPSSRPGRTRPRCRRIGETVEDKSGNDVAQTWRIYPDCPSWPAITS